MNEQEKNLLWQQFLCSGSVADYLIYRQSENKEGKRNETFHQWIDYSGTTRGRE